MEFRIGAKVGRGPFGATYSAQLPDGTVCVVKAITSRFHEHPAALEQVLADARAWAALRHPGLVTTLGVSLYEGRQVILYEQAPGKTLDRCVKEQGPFDPRVAVRVIRDLAVALVAPHRQGLACGDIRAAKVYFDGQRALLADPGQGRGSCLASGFGALGMHFGHPDALAPEVLAERLERPTPACDVYALGILLYELLVGAPPYRGEGKAVLRQHLEAPLPPVPAVQASPALARLLARLVAKAKEQRFADAAAVVEGLFELLGRPAPTPAAGTDFARAPANALTSTVWRTAAQQAAERTSSWSSDRLEKAAPVGPPVGDPRTTTSALPRGLAPAGPPTSEVGETTLSLPNQLTTTTSDLEGSDKKPTAIKLGKKLGQGPVGSVYQGEMKDHPAPVAVKVVSQRFAKYPDLLKRILDAARKAEGFLDAHVVGVLRVMHVAGRETVVSELCEGPTLREAARAGRLNAKQVLDTLRELALALQVARARDLSHGDVRPEKVYLSGGVARLADFGFHEAAGLGANFGQFGVPWGHPDYLAPEVMQEKKGPTFQSDCYALGILAYELLTGRVPFTGPTPKEVLKAHLEAPLPPPPKEAGVPAPLADLLLRLTAKDPKRRFDAPLELLQAIDRCKKQVDLTSQAIASPPVEEFDPTASGEKGQGWMPVQVDKAKAPPKKVVKTTKILEAPAVGPEGWAPGTMLNSDEELPRPPRP
jgi:serine/threonine protein kinase